MAKRIKGQAKVEAIKLESLSVEYLPMDALSPNEYNPNRQSDHEFDLLCRSIQEDGMTQPVIVLKEQRDGKHLIVDGEHRWRACKHLGFEQIPVVKVDMTEEQRRISTLRHNLARGSHDIDLEAGVLRDLEQLGALDWAQDALQLSNVEVERMLDDLTPLDEWGQGEEFGEAWDYTPAGKAYEGGEFSGSEAARRSAQLGQKLAREDMASKDHELVKRNMTFTREQETVVKAALLDKPADTLVAMAEAHVEAKDRAQRGQWTTLTFVVPTEALKVIEDELDRLRASAPNRKPDLTPELQRGLALEFMAVLSGQTPVESL